MDGWSRSMDGRPQDGPRAMADELSGLGRAALLAAAAVRVCETRRGGKRRSCARSARYLAERCVVKQEDERSAAWFIEDGLQRKEGHLTCVRRAAVQKSRVDYRPGRKRDGGQTDRPRETLELWHEGRIRQLAWMNTNTVSWFKHRAADDGGPCIRRRGGAVLATYVLPFVNPGMPPRVDADFGRGWT
ncbi:hypothetical protein VFPFJ_10687 [Purpureocillium lilacinum]|uniref:Uncharacterized protein n=1 Tax=Purpureocillium lilacinum TaxID=33203 RepID=A0A179GEY2_PURLI|nr:hypothetical protein VFPFJ_10687 [Purpureocillium lilacinum]OAQ75923.1 hypothetical protein VFPFJ_10687 [Purpureocillium lilacinum]